MKTIVLNREDCFSRVADEIAALLDEKPNAVLAFSTRRTMRPLFAALAERCAEGKLSLARAGVFAVTEFEDAPEEKSARYQLLTELAAATDLPAKRCRFLTPENAADCDVDIARAGGLDLAVLGLGVNAHIGYNEPGTPYISTTRRQKLSDRTRAQLAAEFGSEEAAPRYAWTMGVGTLVRARRIFVVACGEEKAQAVFQMLYARDDGLVPAAFLQLPPEVTVWLDREAASQL